MFLLLQKLCYVRNGNTLPKGKNLTLKEKKKKKKRLLEVENNFLGYLV